MASMPEAAKSQQKTIKNTLKLLSRRESMLPLAINQRAFSYRGGCRAHSIPMHPSPLKAALVNP